MPRRCDSRAAEVAYWLVTIGTAARIAGEVARPALDGFAVRVPTFTASLLQVAGLLVFFYTMWSRIRPLGSKAREAQGQRF